MDSFSDNKRKSLGEIEQMRGKCGILTVCLIDPLSQLINKISGLKEDDINAVGFYYEAELHGTNKCTVILFNTYDNDPIPWLRLGYTMDSLLLSPFVKKIIYYPLITSDKEIKQNSLLKKDVIPNKIGITKNLDEAFRINVVQTISMNAKAIHDKNLSYTTLLLKIAGITGDQLSYNIITGYSLVNKVMLNLMGIDKIDLNKISSSIIPCPLVKKPLSIIPSKDTSNNQLHHDIEYIIEDSRREITKLIAIFVDLFTSHEQFRINIINYKIPSQNPIANNSSPFFKNLMNQELELISHIIGGLENGFISNKVITEIIHNITKERFNLGDCQQLPICINPSPTVQITNDDIMCTFQQSKNFTINSIKSKYNTDALKNLGDYISHLMDSFNNKDVMTINLGGIVEMYNNIVAETDLPKIISSGNDTPNIKSKSAIVTLSDSTILNIPVRDSREALAIPMYNSNLTHLTEYQLMDILIYIDSLRSSDGSYDTRFSNLQNEITHEIANRKK